MQSPDNWMSSQAGPWAGGVVWDLLGFGDQTCAIGKEGSRGGDCGHGPGWQQHCRCYQSFTLHLPCASPKHRAALCEGLRAHAWWVKMAREAA